MLYRNWYIKILPGHQIKIVHKYQKEIQFQAESPFGQQGIAVAKDYIDNVLAVEYAHLTGRKRLTHQQKRDLSSPSKQPSQAKKK